MTVKRQLLRKYWWALAGLVVLLAVMAIVAAMPAASKKVSRLPGWARPVPAEQLENFYQLDRVVYRSAQPDAAGFREARRKGIRRVLNLRENHSDGEEAAGAGLQLYQVEMEAGSLREEDVVRALRIIRQSPEPVLVHCWHGSDRTGAVCAFYRMVFQDWSKEEAIAEMMEGGYGFHPVYTNITGLIRQADVPALRKLLFAEGG